MPATYRPIPLIYKGIRFDARLEARWAAFFDLLHWGWDYGPFDFETWFPALVLYGAEHHVLVDVQPVLTFPAARSALIDASSAPQECLIVGRHPLITPSHPDTGDEVQLGWLREVYEPGQSAWEAAMMGLWSGSESVYKNPDRRLGFCHAVGSFHDRITGCYDGGCHGEGDTLPRGLVAGLWQQACAIIPQEA